MCQGSSSKKSIPPWQTQSLTKAREYARLQARRNAMRLTNIFTAVFLLGIGGCSYRPVPVGSDGGISIGDGGETVETYPAGICQDEPCENAADAACEREACLQGRCFTPYFFTTSDNTQYLAVQRAVITAGQNSDAAFTRVEVLLRGAHQSIFWPKLLVFDTAEHRSARLRDTFSVSQNMDSDTLYSLHELAEPLVVPAGTSQEFDLVYIAKSSWGHLWAGYSPDAVVAVDLIKIAADTGFETCDSSTPECWATGQTICTTWGENSR